jgi:hypothetical protein
LTALVNETGHAHAFLPLDAAAHYGDPPALSCYVGPPDDLWWAVVSDGFEVDAPYCSLEWFGGRFLVATDQAPPGWTALWVVVY